MNPRPNKTFTRAPLTFAGLALAACVIAGCPPAPTPPTKAQPPSVIAAAAVRWRLDAARRETSFVKLDLPMISAGMRITLGEPLVMVPASALAEGATTQPSTPPAGDAMVGVPDPSWRGSIELFTSRIVRGTADGPLVDQLTGEPRMATDAGSFLVALPPLPQPKGAPATSARVFDVSTPMPLFFRVSIPPAAAPGEYRVPIRISAPGKPDDDSTLALQVSDLSLPTDPRVLAVATTDIAELSRIYPDTFGTITANYLDRTNPDHKAAIAQLDMLVKAARANGVALFIEDLTPVTRVDELGQVNLDWDAYDRVMQPYMDGTAFDDRIPLPVWLAPVPPRRIRDAPTQLWQYIDACAKHFAAKGWVATPAFLHPALAGNGDADDAGSDKLRAQVADTMRLHMPRDMLAVSTPDPGGPPHGQLWTINDSDPRLPPAGPLGNEFSVRAWPWLCVARGNVAGGSPTGVKGFVWRDAVARADELTADAARSPLLVVHDNVISPSFRMMYLNAGINDSALLGLLERRSDPTNGPVAEMLAGMVGRTATAAKPEFPELPLAAPGFLYAGWSADRSLWNQLPSTLQRLIVENDPGKRATMSSDDPLHIAAAMWLASSRKPVARIAGYTWSIRPGRAGGSDILDAGVHILAENPIDAPADVDVQFTSLPGDFDMPTDPAAQGDEAQQGRHRKLQLAAAGAAIVNMPIAGHVDELHTAPAIDTLTLSERFDGASSRLPVQIPIYRMHPTASPPKTDGDGVDWPLDTQTRVYGEMTVGTRYLTRPDLVSATLQPDSDPAALRWTYDDQYLYVLARCPQDAVSDERNTNWPLRQAGPDSERWWGTDGLQIELAPMPPTAAPLAAGTGPAASQPADTRYDRVVKIAFKPAGVVLIQTGTVSRQGGAATIAWRDGAPAAAGNPNVKYGITTQRQSGHVVGYTVEAAIPRAWIDVPGAMAAGGTKAPAWRLNVLRHRGEDCISTSWAGPVVDDNDVAMMGAMVGE